MYTKKNIYILRQTVQFHRYTQIVQNKKKMKTTFKIKRTHNLKNKLTFPLDNAVHCIILYLSTKQII